MFTRSLSRDVSPTTQRHRGGEIKTEGTPISQGTVVGRCGSTLNLNVPCKVLNTHRSFSHHHGPSRKVLLLFS